MRYFIMLLATLGLAFMVSTASANVYVGGGIGFRAPPISIGVTTGPYYGYRYGYYPSYYYPRYRYHRPHRYYRDEYRGPRGYRGGYYRVYRSW